MPLGDILRAGHFESKLPVTGAREISARDD